MPDLRRALAVLAAAFATLAAAQQGPAPAEPPPSAAPASPPAPPRVPPAEPPTSVQPGASQPALAEPPSRATPRPGDGLTFAVRGAWLKPHGIVAGVVGSDNELPLDKELSSGTQLTLEAGYRFAFGATAGLFLQYGFVRPRSIAGGGLCETSTCDAGRTLKYGVEVLVHFLRDRPLSPFVGAGFGLERSGYDVSDPAGRATIRYEGVQVLDAQLGADYAVSPRAFVGAFVANSFGRYDKVAVKGSGVTVAGDVAKKRTHSWLQAGLRAGFAL